MLDSQQKGTQFSYRGPKERPPAFYVWAQQVNTDHLGPETWPSPDIKFADSLAFNFSDPKIAREKIVL